mgnify:CR=1 FL=1
MKKKIKSKSFNKNIVTGEILDIQPNNFKSLWVKDKLYSIGDDISGQITKCYTYDKSCCWFKKDNKNYLNQKNWSLKILDSYNSNNINDSITILIDEFRKLQPILTEFDYNTKKEILQMLRAILLIMG